MSGSPDCAGLPQRATTAPGKAPLQKPVRFTRAQAFQPPRHAFCFAGADGQEFGIGQVAGCEVAAVQVQVERGCDQFQPGRPFAQQALQGRGVQRRFCEFDAQFGRWRGGVTRLLVQHAQREGGHACMARLRPGHQARQQHAGAVQTNAAGQVVLKLKTPWRDGTTHLVMSPLEFMQRLAALVPRPLAGRVGPLARRALQGA